MRKFLVPLFFVLIIAVLAGVVFLTPKYLKRESGVLANHSKPAQTDKAESPLKASQIPAPPPQSANQEKAILEIRNELQAVMDLNKKINSVQQSRSAQMLRIQEQAQIQQKILNDIQKNSTSVKPVIPSREALLAQEKLRIIREEAVRNKKILEDTARKTVS